VVAAEVLERVEAYRITEIPRQPDAGHAQAPADQRNDSGRAQRAAALAAAYHAGTSAGDHGALTFGWVRHQAGGPVQFLAAGAGLVGGGKDDVFPDRARRSQGAAVAGRRRGRADVGTARVARRRRDQ